MTLSLRLAATLLLASAAALSGCRSVKYDPSGETAAVYGLGEFKMLVNSTAPLTARATEAAFQQFDLYKVVGIVNKFDARFEGRARNDQKVLVIISEANSRQTLVRIRWGAGGNLAQSRKFFDAIDANIGK